MRINTDGLQRFYIEVSKHHTQTDTNGQDLNSLYNKAPSNFNDYSKKIDWINKSHSYVPNKIHSIWSRFAIPFQSIFIAIDMVFTQTIRAGLLALGGVVTLDLRKLKVAALDAISIPVQSLLLPILASAAVISPKRAAWVTAVICKKIENKVIADRHTSDNPSDPLLRKGNRADRIYGIFVGIISIPTVFVRANLSFYVNSIGLHILDSIGSVGLATFGTFKQITRTQRAAFKEKTEVRDRLFYAFHGSYGAHSADKFFALLLK